MGVHRQCVRRRKRVSVSRSVLENGVELGLWGAHT